MSVTKKIIPSLKQYYSEVHKHSRLVVKIAAVLPRAIKQWFLYTEMSDHEANVSSTCLIYKQVRTIRFKGCSVEMASQH